MFRCYFLLNHFSVALLVPNMAISNIRKTCHVFTVLRMECSLFGFLRFQPDTEQETEIRKIFWRIHFSLEMLYNRRADGLESSRYQLEIKMRNLCQFQRTPKIAHSCYLSNEAPRRDTSPNCTNRFSAMGEGSLQLSADSRSSEGEPSSVGETFLTVQTHTISYETLSAKRVIRCEVVIWKLLS